MPLNVLRDLENKKGPPLPALAVGVGILVLLLSVTAAVVYAWAPTLTEMGMDSLRQGMTEEEVRGRMGPPSHSDERDGYPVWLYDTWRKNRQPYVVFTTNRVVRAFGVADYKRGIGLRPVWQRKPLVCLAPGNANQRLALTHEP